MRCMKPGNEREYSKILEEQENGQWINTGSGWKLVELGMAFELEKISSSVTVVNEEDDHPYDDFDNITALTPGICPDMK